MRPMEHVHTAALRALAHLLRPNLSGDAEGNGNSECEAGSTAVTSENGTDAEAHGQQEKEGGQEAVGHSGGRLQIRRTRLDERFERDLALREVAHCDHEFRRNTVIRHLADSPSRDAEVVRERFVSAALCIKPSLE